MSRKIIGIVGWKTGDNSFGVTVPYFEYLSKFGDVVIISPDQYTKVDLLVLPGGKDVNPARYNQRPKLTTSDPNMILEYFDLYVLPEYIKNNVPIFAICRGLQTLNVFFGGTLKQHIPYHPYSSLSRDEKVHEVFIVDQEIAKRFKGKIKTNSMHHQSIDKLGEGIEIVMKSQDDIIEAIKHINKPIYAVQYHPEETNCIIAANLIKELLG